MSGAKDQLVRGTRLVDDPSGIANRIKPYLPDLLRPPGQARGLPGWIYSDPAVFELERKRIFARAWVGIAYDSDVAKPGDVMATDYAGWRFILARGEDGGLRCFHNICRHRGMVVVEGRKSNCRGISCPWHMWTYDLQGRLVGTPNLGGTGVHDCADFTRGDLGLMALRTESWMGVVFVNIDGQAPPLRDYLQPTADRLAAFDLSLVRESTEQVETGFDGNWKLAVEGGVEDYHIPWVHRQLGPSGDFAGEGMGDSYVGVVCRRSMEVAKARYAAGPDTPAGPALPMFPHFPATGSFEASVILATLPATLITAVTDHVVVSLFIPETPCRTRVRRRFHFIGTAAAGDEHAAARRRVRDSWSLVTEQDAPLIARMQELALLRDDVGFRPRFSPYWEPAVHHFQKVIAGKLTAQTLV